MFKFEEFPEINKVHEMNEKMLKKMYSAEMKHLQNVGDDNLNHWQKSIDEGLNFKTHVYSKVVFDIFSKLRPKLTLVRSGEKMDWNSVFGQDYDVLTNSQKKHLAMMIEDEMPYRLPDEYYNNKDWFEEVKKKS